MLPAGKVAQQQNTHGIHLPAPIGGVNALQGASAMSPQDCLYLYNMVPGEYGVRTRDGYREWQTGLNGKPVYTIMAFSSRLDADKLFAVTSEGIWDVTVFGAAPVHLVTFGTQSLGAGYGQWTNFVSLDSSNILVYCDEANGVYFYNESSSGTWRKAGTTDFQTTSGYTPPPPGDLVSVVGWKNRLWYIQRKTGTAWYTPIGSYRGTGTNSTTAMLPFQFGNKFTYGGYLLNLWNWTVDGGFGIDDYLVGLSSRGDVVIYQGTDPTATTGDYFSSFSMKGVWFIGQPPAGRRQAANYGGDLVMLSQRGMVPLSRLLQGQALTADLYSTKKISGYITNDMEETIAEIGWEMVIHAQRNCIIVNTPKEYGRFPGQYVMFAPTQSWAFYRDVPAQTWGLWKGKTYFGTTDGRICTHEGGLDNVTLAGDGANGINWSVLTSFTDWQAPARNKRGHFVRPLFIADTVAPSYLAEFRYNFDLRGVQYGPVFTTPDTSNWDTGRWDVAKWGGGYVFAQNYFGGEGMGQHCAIALRGGSTAETVLVGFDILFDVGGYL